MKRNLAFSLLFIAIMVFAANAVSLTTAQNANAKIAIVYSTGGLGDQSFNDAAFAGKERAETDFPGITVQQVEPETVTEINTAIENFASDGSFDLIIAIGFSAADGVNASAVAHPSQKFMIVDSVVDQPNVASVTFKEHEGSFLVGAMAAMVTKTNKTGFLGGLDIPLINKFRYGFEQGVKYINPNAEVLVAYSPDPSKPFSDQAGGQTVANGFIEQGADVIYAAAGGTGLGVFDAVAEHDQGEVYAIGVDSNQDHLKPGYILTSMIKKVDVAVYTQIEAIVDGTWSATINELGLKEDGVDISPMNFTQTERDTLYANDKTRFEIVQDIKQAIINGSLTVSPDSVPTDLGTYPVNFYNIGEANTDENPLSISLLPFGIATIVTAVVLNRRRR